MAVNRHWVVILGLLACYGIGFGLYYPKVVTVADEASYLLQAKYFSQGRLRAAVVDPITGESTLRVGSEYPIGTSLLIAPFFRLGGLRGAYLFPLAMLICAVLITAKWLADAGYSPLWAMLMLGYVPTLVLGRISMSDIPSAVIVTLAYWCFWRGNSAGKHWWFWAGLLAGMSLLFRETNILLCAILFLGAMLRNEKQWGLLVVGSVLGASSRLISAFVMFGDPWFHKAVLHGFGLESFGRNLLVYGIALLCFFPGGFLIPLWYKGVRKIEFQLTTLLFVGFYLVYQYSGEESGFLKSLILGPRFFIPLTPLLAFQMAEVGPRLWKRLEAAFVLPTWLRFALITCGVAGVALTTFGVNWGMFEYTQADAKIRDGCYRVIPEQSVVIGNSMAIRKYINALYGEQLLIDFRFVAPDQLERLLQHEKRLFFVQLQRDQSEFWRLEKQHEDEFFSALSNPVTILTDQRIDSTRHLMIAVMESPKR